MFIVNPYIYATPGYLLDTYSAAAAYSLRQLKTGVTNVVRVRRSSDNAESDFTATEITDGTLTTWTGANNGFVVTWYDQSGNGNDVTQSTAGNQPQIVSSGSVLLKNTKPYCDFDGSDDFLVLASTNVLPAAGNGWSIASVSHNDVTAIGIIFTSGQNIGVNRVIHQCDRSTNKRVLSVVSSGTDAVTALNNQVDISDQRLYFTYDDASNNVYPYYNGVLQTSASYTGTYTNNYVRIGCQQSTVQHLNGGIQEFIIFSSDESANRAAIESDINTHYSIY